MLDHDVAQGVSDLAPRARTHANRPFAELTEREHDILELIAQGLDNQTIARRLVLSPKTVRNHVSNVLAKLNAADRSQAIVLSRERGRRGGGRLTPPRRLTTAVVRRRAAGGRRSSR